MITELHGVSINIINNMLVHIALILILYSLKQTVTFETNSRNFGSLGHAIPNIWTIF